MQLYGGERCINCGGVQILLVHSLNSVPMDSRQLYAFSRPRSYCSEIWFLFQLSALKAVLMVGPVCSLETESSGRGITVHNMHKTQSP